MVGEGVKILIFLFAYWQIVGFVLFLPKEMGGVAQLARALAWHARGRRFDPDTLHLMFLKFVKFIKFMAWSVSETETFH